MTDDFIPTSSIDGHTMPMDPHIPLLQSSLNSGDSNNANTRKPQSSSNMETRSAADHNRSPGQDVTQSPSNESTTLQTPYKLIDVPQIKTLPFYQALLSEFIGTFLLTLVCTSTGLPITTKSVPDLNGALAAGFVVATIIVGFGHTSGAHINPAVTVSFLVAREIDLLRALCYIAIQLCGAMGASFLVKSLAPSYAEGNLGMTMITEGISIYHAFIVEVIITFMLCYTVHAICDKRRDDIGGSKALAAGLVVTVGCLFGGPYTGASMNPARSFGPALVMNSWKNHWVYWFGPLTGSIVAALIYTQILTQQPRIVVRSGPRSYLNNGESNHV